MPTLINWDILREPLNWIIVALMVAIGSFGLCLALGKMGPGAAQY